MRCVSYLLRFIQKSRWLESNSFLSRDYIARVILDYRREGKGKTGAIEGIIFPGLIQYVERIHKSRLFTIDRIKHSKCKEHNLETPYNELKKESKKEGGRKTRKQLNAPKQQVSEIKRLRD